MVESKINFEEDRIESVTQVDAAKSLSDKVLKLKDLEDEILNAEESVNKLKEQARILSQVDNSCHDAGNAYYKIKAKRWRICRGETFLQCIYYS
jgi:hypothetical protein